MNRQVAESARLVFGGLVMEAWGGRGANARIQRVAADAEQIDLVLVEHALIR